MRTREKWQQYSFRGAGMIESSAGNESFFANEHNCNRLLLDSPFWSSDHGRVIVSEKDSKRRFQRTFEDTLDEVITRRNIQSLLQTRLPNDFVPSKASFNRVRSRHDRNGASVRSVGQVSTIFRQKGRFFSAADS